ncbi:ABC transporter substrate-binding protein [Streptomyces sp. WMMB 322]|uniref:ABC transporter substrate-binding protein n=1 Tax=Streptomyces sp. WMMB 322 TaxID=1286821 RepID=UPI0006E18FDC|nr:ABC transporter substrate-binding protein [Streptomyces sp. WMMB 322]SCK16981.1 peptide/nickel transport system substrate-binding protein [Streptomyces sp. WMMB 322]
MNRRTLTPLALVGLLASTLVACSGAVDGRGDQRKPIVVGTTAKVAVTEDTPAPFDPAASYDIGSWNIMRNTFQTLLRPPRSGTEPVTDAAEKCRFAGGRNDQYSCTLRDGLTFSNGNKLTAEDVEFSIERLLRLNVQGGPASLLGNVAKVESEGADKVVFHLKKPDATFPYKLATPAASIVDSRTYPADRLAKGFKRTGSGPYVLDDFDSKGRKVLLTRNSDYRGGSEAKNDKIELRFFRSSEALQKALESGRIDMMNRGITSRFVQQLEADRDKGIRLVEQPGQGVRYLVFDTEDKTVGRRAVRQAFAQVIDRKQLVGDVYSRTAEPLYSIVPGGLLGHTNSFFNEYGEPDVEAAKRTLREADVKTPVKLSLHYPRTSRGSSAASEFAVLGKQLNESGVFDATLESEPPDSYSSAALEGKYQVYGFGWLPDFPDADNFIAPFLEKDNVLNSPYSNKEIREELIPQTRREPDRADATRKFTRAQNIVARDVPVLPLWQGKQYVAAHDDITGVEWALNSSSLLQLWELDRGVDG